MEPSTSLWHAMLGGEVRYRQAGAIRTRSLEAGEGEPLVLLHGNGGHAEIFQRNIVPLAARHRVHAIDLIGHGLSDKPEHLSYTIPDYVQHVIDFLDAIGAKSAHLLGHGMSGWVATYVAVHHPERVKSLISLNGLTRLRANDAQVSAGFEKLKTLSQQAVGPADAEAVRKRLMFAVADPSSVTEELVRVRHAIYFRADSAAVMAKVLGVESPEQQQYALSAEELARLKIPVLLIFAEKHPIERLENFQELAKRIPGSRLEVLEGAGLLAMWEKPDELNALVRCFLDQ
jgi:2-hydroxy-6-oxonona-2,4-dienedioate hydrolase